MSDPSQQVVDLWYLELDDTVQHVQVILQFLYMGKYGLIYNYTNDDWATTNWIFQPWSRIARIGGTGTTISPGGQ